MINQKYLKYCSIQQLKNQIDSRFFNIHDKITKLHHPLIHNQSDLNRRFYDYVSQITQKQKEYNHMMSEPDEIVSLLNKRKRKIDQSLEKYLNYDRKRPLSNFSYERTNNRRNFSMNATVESFYIKSKQSDKQPLKQIKNENRSNIIEIRDFQDKQYSSNIVRQSKIKTQATQNITRSNRLSSINKVVDISINTKNKKTKKDENLFTFQKKNKHGNLFTFSKKAFAKGKKKYGQQQKRINFSSLIDQKSIIDQKVKKKDTKKLRLLTENASNNWLSIRELTQKKIKNRIKLNFNDFKNIYLNQAPIADKYLELRYNKQNQGRLELKSMLISRLVHQQKIKDKRVRVHTTYQYK